MTNDKPKINQIVKFEGEDMVVLEDDGRYSCKYAYVEEVDYNWFTDTAGTQVVIPVNVVDHPPVVMCGHDTNKLKGCFGRAHCKYYDRVRYD